MKTYAIEAMRTISLASVVYVAIAATGHKALASAEDGNGAEPDSQMQAVLDELTKLDPAPLSSVPAAEARKQPTPADAVKALLENQGKSTIPEAVARVVDQSIEGPGGDIAIRIYTPEGEGPFPVIVYYHGGGWVIADLDVYDATPRAMANAAGAVVVSSHYRQAPEHKFPSAHGDAFAAYQWTLEKAGQFNGDPNRVAVMGESAGGNLAAAVSVMAREQGAPIPVHQVLVYPIAGYDFRTASYVENANAKPLNRPAMEWFFDQYLNNSGEGLDPLISLSEEENLEGLPSTTVITAQIDPLRSEGKAYADALENAGIDVRYQNYDGVTHEFFGMAAVVDKAKEAQQFAAQGLKQAFSQ